MTRILANDHDAPVTADDTAFVTDFLDARSNLHISSYLSLKKGGEIKPQGPRGSLTMKARAKTVVQSKLRVLRPVRDYFLLFVPIRDATSSEVVRSEFYLDAVAWQNSDVVTAHLSRNVAEHFVAILKLDPEHCVRERLGNGALKDNRIFLGLWQNNLPQRGGTWAALCCVIETGEPDVQGSRT